MTSTKRFAALGTVAAALALLNGCGSGSGSCSASSFQASSYANVGTASGTNANVMTITVNGANCGARADQYANEPCAAVTICSPSQPGNCQTIDNLLLDTGSFGLRIFGSAISVPLADVTDGSSNSLAECVQFGDGSSEWGPVKYAYVKLGGEAAVAMPIHVVDSGYGTPPAACSSSQSVPDVSPAQAGFNGILGVGQFRQDCGANCADYADNGQYFTCNGGDCSCGATVATSAQVQNPVALLPIDNNGVILELPSATPPPGQAGLASLNGSLLLGIGTRANNTLTGTTTYPTDDAGNFVTTFSAYSNRPVTSFIDSGSNSFALPTPANGSLPDCGSTYGSRYSGAFCPSSPVTFSAVNYGATSSASGTVNFSVGNAYSELNSPYYVFGDYGTSSGGLTLSPGTVYFDWGLPFFFGRNLAVGLEGASSGLGSGTYWAY